MVISVTAVIENEYTSIVQLASAVLEFGQIVELYVVGSSIQSEAICDQ